MEKETFFSDVANMGYMQRENAFTVSEKWSFSHVSWLFFNSLLAIL